MSEEGFVKYTCDRLAREVAGFDGFEQVNVIRTRLRELGLIGEYANGVGYGNISSRIRGSQQFHISGARTGGLRELVPAHYAKVLEFDVARNWVKCEGAIPASSEAMTHAAVYAASPATNGVIHVHHPELWRALLDRVPTTSRNVEYGTPAMAEEIGRLFRETKVGGLKIIVMAGHEDGIITFGGEIGMAMDVLLKNAEAFGINLQAWGQGL